MKKAIVTIVVAIAVMGLTACQQPEAQESAEQSITAVQVETVVGVDLPVEVEAVGRLVPNREVMVSAQVPGIVASYAADVGDKVSKGQRLVKIDDTDYVLSRNQAKAGLLAAQARLAVAQSSYERSKRLLPDKAITLEAYDRAEAEFKSAQASEAQLKATLDVANRQIEKTTIAAPFGGYITQRAVEIGQNIRTEAMLMTLADMQTMRVQVYLSEQDYVHLDKEDPVTVRIEAFGDRAFKGVVDTIGIEADARTNTFEVEILVDNPDNLLKAGLTARVTLRVDKIANAVMIQQSAVLFRENRREVFVVDDDNKARERQVTLGRTNGAKIQVTQGLEPGDRLVISGAQYLKPGDMVSIAP